MAWRKSGLSHTAEEILVMTCEGRGALAYCDSFMRLARRSSRTVDADLPLFFSPAP